MSSDHPEENAMAAHPEAADSADGQAEPDPPPANGSAMPDANGNNAAMMKLKAKMEARRAMSVLPDVNMVLDSNTLIKWATKTIEKHTGWHPNDIKGRFLKDLVHPDDSAMIVRETSWTVANGEHVRFIFRLLRGGPAPQSTDTPAGDKPPQEYVILEASGHAHHSLPPYSGNPINKSPFCRGVFMSWRPYLTKHVRLMDRFLEAKVENLRLRRGLEDQVAESLREEADDLESLSSARSSRRESIDGESDGGAPISPLWAVRVGRDVELMPPPPLPAGASSGVGTAVTGPGGAASTRASVLTSTLTAANLQSVNIGSRPDLVGDKMARLLTRSEGTGDPPGVATGDVGIAKPPEPRNKNKRNKRAVQVQVCTDCGECSPTFHMPLRIC
jgi:hypothetical protein